MMEGHRSLTSTGPASPKEATSDSGFQYFRKRLRRPAATRMTARYRCRYRCRSVSLVAYHAVIFKQHVVRILHLIGGGQHHASRPLNRAEPLVVDGDVALALKMVERAGRCERTFEHTVVGEHVQERLRCRLKPVAKFGLQDLVERADLSNQ